VIHTEHIRKPEWLKVEKGGGRAGKVGQMLVTYGLNSVCEEAGCPNRGECFRSGTATFMLLGNRCTRNCAFCKVTKGAPEAPNPGEPENVAKAAAAMSLKHVVLTSVTRDDLPDGGAAHFAAVVRAVKKALPSSTVETLIPDFKGDESALRAVLDAHPDILNHNIETVPELYGKIRPMAVFERSVELLCRSKTIAPEIYTKSGFMVGLGESESQVKELLRALHGAGCDIVTIGQYLRPSLAHYAVKEYVEPGVFESYKRFGLEIGIARVTSEPLARSSYRAEADIAYLRKNAASE
jgi:lipoic acid synthetase